MLNIHPKYCSSSPLPLEEKKIQNWWKNKIGTKGTRTHMSPRATRAPGAGQVGCYVVRMPTFVALASCQFKKYKVCGNIMSQHFPKKTARTSREIKSAKKKVTTGDSNSQFTKHDMQSNYIVPGGNHYTIVPHGKCQFGSANWLLCCVVSGRPLMSMTLPV